MEFIMQKQSNFKTSSFYHGDAVALPNQVSNEATSSVDSTSIRARRLLQATKMAAKATYT